VKRRGGDIEQIGAVDFYEQSHFFIETLKDDLCQKDEGGWYTMKDQVDSSTLGGPLHTDDREEEIVQPFALEKQARKPEEAHDPLIFKKGHWTDGEH